MTTLIETLNRWGEAAIPLAGQMLWQTSLLIIVLLALDLLLRHHIRAGFRYALWMLLLVKLVLPPSLALPTGAGYWIERPVKAAAPVEAPVAEVASLPAPAVEVNHAADPGIIVEADFFDHLLAEAMAEAPPATTVLESPTSPAPTTNTPAIQLTWRGQLLAAWLAGTLLLLGWMLWRWRWVTRLVRASEPAPADLQALLANVYRHNVCRAACPTPSVLPASCRHFPETDRTAEDHATDHERKGDIPVAQSRIEATGVSPFRFFATPPTIPVRLTDAAMSPAVCGLFRPVILLPRKLVGKLSREQLGTVLLHELIHLRRRDLWVNCVQTLLQIAAWWHPLLWVANARIRRVREEAVDEAVACALRDDADAYPATLLEVAKLTFTRPLMTLGLVGILESKHALKQRIRRLLELPPLESTRLKWWQWLAVAAIALVAVPMAEGQRSAGIGEDTTQWLVDAAFIQVSGTDAAFMLPRSRPDIETESVRAWIVQANGFQRIWNSAKAAEIARGNQVVLLPAEMKVASEGRRTVLGVTHQVVEMRPNPDYAPPVYFVREGDERILQLSDQVPEPDLSSRLVLSLEHGENGLRAEVSALSRTKHDLPGLPDLTKEFRGTTNFHFTTVLALPADAVALALQPKQTIRDRTGGDIVLISLNRGSADFTEPVKQLRITAEGQLLWEGTPLDAGDLVQRLIDETGRQSWLRVEIDAANAPQAMLMDVMRRLSWAQFWNVSLNPAVWEQAHGSVRFSVRPLAAAEVAPRLAELLSDEILQKAVDALAEPDRALFPTVEAIRPLVGARYRQGAFPLEVAVNHADAKAAARAALEIAWAYRQGRRNVKLAAEDAARIDDDPENPRRAGLRIRDIIVAAPGNYQVGAQAMSLEAISAAIREEATRNPRFELVEVRTLDAQGEEITPPKELREALRSAGVRKIARYWQAVVQPHEDRARDQDLLSPQSGVGNPAVITPRQLAAVNATRPPITMQVRAVKLSRRAWQELTNRVGTQAVSGQAQAFIHPEAGLDDWLAGHAEVETIESGRITAPERRTSILGAGSIDGAADAASRARIELTTWRDTQGANQVWLQLNAAINWSGPVTIDGGPVPTATGTDATSTGSAGVTFGTNTRGYVNQQLATAGVKLTAGQWAIIGGPAEGQTEGPVFAVVASPLFAQGARLTPGQESENSAGTSSAEHNIRSETPSQVKSPPLTLGHTNLTEYGAQMITPETLFPDPRVSGYRMVGLEPRFVLVPVEGLSRALGGQLPLARPLIIASNELAALTNSLIEAGAVDHSSASPARFSKMSGGVFHWQVAKEEPSQVVFQPADNPSTNAAASPRQIVFGARHGVPAFAPDWVPLTLLARPFAGDDESLRSILSLATGEQQPVLLAQAEETIPLGASLIWASTNEVRAGFAQAVILHNSGPPAEKADESADGAVEATTKIQNAKELIEAGKLDEAEALLREAAKADPGNSMVSYYFAQINRARQPVEFERAELKEPLTEGQRKLMEKLNRITLDRVEFDSVPLVEAVKDLSDESRRRDPEKEGIKFMIAGSIDVTNYEDDPGDSTGRPPPTRPTTRLEIGDPKITINPPMSDVRMIDVLNAVVRSAGEHVEFVVEEFAVVFRPKLPAQSALQTRVFRLNPDTFEKGKLAAIASSPTPSGAVTNDMSVVNLVVRDFFEAAGVSLLAPKMIYFNERTGMLMVKATLADLEIVQRAVEMLNYEPPQVALEVRTVEVTKDDVRALGFDWFLGNTIEPITGPLPAHPATTITGVLTDPQFRVVLKALEQRPNASVEFFPRTTTLSSRSIKLKSTIVLSNMVVAVTNTPAGQSYITEDVEVGTKLDVMPQVGADGFTIRLGVMFERTDFLGYSDAVEAGKPAGTSLPRFKLFSMATAANVWDGQTLVLAGTPPEPGLQSTDAERRHFLLFITPTIIDPGGNRVQVPLPIPMDQE
jgi:Zn-dependent protease with chaperone function